MYEDFDFSVLDSCEFKEDAVREELIAPLIRRLGYRASGPDRVQRSKTLVHPFVMIGSKRNQINIVPDYTLYVQDEPKVVIEAKGPQEQIVNSHHVEQAYSYAIHPEVRAGLYALCNGRELIVYSISQWNPVLRVNLLNVEQNWSLVEEALHPRFLLNPELKGFMPDYGLAMLKIGIRPGTLQLIVLHHLQSVMRAEDDLYVFNTTTSAGDIECLVTLDMTAVQYQELLSELPPEVAAPISAAMKRAPYQMALDGKIMLTCSGHLSDVTRGAYEEFAPIRVSEISKVVYEPTAELSPYEPRKAV
jgi:Type I restriction enzyme R protein N terminus (HSDR_N)